MKVLITGGHFSPAYSVIQELLKRGDAVAVVGRKHPFEGDKESYSYEYRVSKELKIPFIQLSTGRLQRRISRHTVVSLLRFISGFFKAVSIINLQKPDILLTFGGYLALPVAIAARLKKIPIVTHEQTQRIGLSNRIIAKIADTVCVSFASSKKELAHKNVVLTGNPIRAEVFRVEERIEHPKNLPLIYITGGSTGSHVINMAVQQILPSLLQKYVVIHQTGENEFNDFTILESARANLSGELAKRYILKKFIFPDQIGYIYQSADLLIGRSGANTILELIACNKPSILIPLPHGQKGEQLLNARLVDKIGLGITLEQNQLSPESLLQAIESIFDSLETYHIGRDIIEQYIFEDAASRIVHELYAQYEKKNQI